VGRQGFALSELTQLPWEPLGPAEVAGLFTGVPWWCVAGGHAIELAVGRRLRPHSDIDVLLLRRDQLAAQHALAGWEWWAADPQGALLPWQRGEILLDGVHDVWCRPSGIPYLTPEIRLFYKAKSPRPKDQADFDATLPLLSAAQRRWLTDTITATQGSHSWLNRLAGNDVSDSQKDRLA
jgi:hypothetical protein